MLPLSGDGARVASRVVRLLSLFEPYRNVETPRRTELVRPSLDATFAAESLAESIHVFRLLSNFNSGTKPAR